MTSPRTWPPSLALLWLIGVALRLANALSEQLSLYEEFKDFRGGKTAPKGVQAAKAATKRIAHPHTSTEPVLPNCYGNWNREAMSLRQGAIASEQAFNRLRRNSLRTGNYQGSIWRASEAIGAIDR